MSGWIGEGERLDAEATPGPWWLEHDRNDQAALRAPDNEYVAVFPHQCLAAIQTQREKDAKAVAHMRTHYPKASTLLREVAGDLEAAHRMLPVSRRDGDMRYTTPRNMVERVLAKLREAGALGGDDA